MIKLALTAAAILSAATPALAGQTHYQPTAQDFRDGVCTRQQVHTPAGKMVHNAPIVRCDAAALASRDQVEASRERTAATSGVDAPESARW